MILDKNRIFDGWQSLEGGVDAGRAPTLLDPNQVYSADNMVFRGGHPKTRPGWRKLTETFKNPLHSYYATYSPPDPAHPEHYRGQNAVNDDGSDIYIPGEDAETSYRNGTFQCALGYSPHLGEDCLMALIHGRLYKIVPRVTDAIVTEIPLPYRNTTERPIGYMVQADKWLIAQDGQSLPILYDGAIARRALATTDPEKTEVPVGTIMAYGMGRIVVIVNDREIAFGDLYGSHDLPDPADSLILFTERNFLSEGADAQIPFQQGQATGAIFFPQLDTSTGNGQLMVFAERGAASFFLSLPRELWKTSAFQILSLLTTGLRGHRSISAVNEDLWFRSEDGWRSYRQARSEPSGWAHIPLSTNVRQFMEADTDWLLKYASSIYFDNRIIGTCSPVWYNGRPCHFGLVVVDFDILSSFGTKYRPAWDGAWHKLYTCQIVTGRFNGITRAFAFGIDGETNTNQLYELSMNDKNDWDGPISWELVSRSFDFSKISQQGNPFSENELYDADIWLREIRE